ncbi:ATP-binding protein [uncultured Thiothrix sp.]|uniref:BbrUII/HgiDII family restriction enzyme n=1 Tax=uncultured Thiothrix sp. TaxID=223185 RepID=UPI002627C89B|nr:ATP-binding protein [uncultured Thiothrix sp.]
MNDSQFMLSLDLNVLNHLGLSLYSSTPAVLTEIIANAYDADASRVSITIDETQGRIVIIDDGHGMNENDVRNKFLKVGFARRDHSPKSVSGRRYVMGRKGIGKLAMFSLANIVEVTTRTASSDEPIAIKVNVSDLKKAIQDKQDYPLAPITPSELLTSPSGTAIVLSELTRSTVVATEKYLAQRLARRFSVIGTDTAHPFTIFLNEKEITLKDRGFHQDIQFFWSFSGKEAQENLDLCTSIETINQNKCVQELQHTFGSPSSEGGILSIRGYIASARKPKDLKNLDSNINQIAIFANGRIFQEDILPELSNSDHFNNYLVGEIHADFLDQDNTDRATSSREAIIKNDPLFITLLEHLKTALKEVSSAWGRWRRDIDYSILPNKNKAIESWLNTLKDARDRNLAKKLVMSIHNAKFSDSDEEDDDHKRNLYRGLIIAFEKLKARQNLILLENITDVFSHKFQSIFANINDMEETYYWEITKYRMEVIDKFKKIIDTNALEKVAQTYLFEHLWLLDPTWDRVSDIEMERVLTEELKKITPTAESGARIDIAYRSSAGRQIIIELKRPGLKINHYKLLEQVDKYRDAVSQYIKENPTTFNNYNGATLPFEICILLENDITQDNERMRVQLANSQARIITYKGLLTNAYRVYNDYIEANQKVSNINQLVEQI